jgi:hypothetical protein
LSDIKRLRCVLDELDQTARGKRAKISHSFKRYIKSQFKLKSSSLATELSVLGASLGNLDDAVNEFELRLELLLLGLQLLQLLFRHVV